MRGTTQALRAVFGLGIGADYDDEFVVPVKGAIPHL
jgi:hypothetical protein